MSLKDLNYSLIDRKVLQLEKNIESKNLLNFLNIEFESK